MYIPLHFEKNIKLDGLTKENIVKIIENENSIYYKLNEIIVAVPTETEVKVVESKTSMSYSEYLALFLTNNNIKDICKKYGATEDKDVPFCVAMAVFESV